MSQQRATGRPHGRRPVTGPRTTGRGASVARRAAGAAVTSAAVIGALAGCSTSSGTDVATSPPPVSATSGTASAAATAGSPATSASAAAFTPIVEPFNPGHPARTRPAPASCGGQPTTLAIEQCYEAKIESADAQIDAVQQARYQSVPQDQRAAFSAGDAAWLSARQPVCARAFHGGGTIDEIDTAGCLLAESTARLDAVKGITPPETVLRSTDSTDPSALSWYTTPEGSRIAMLDTQGDSSGGAIIGGAQGFLVNPAQFTYVDGSYTNHGKVQAPSPAGHRVPSGAEYQFDIDYRHLSADPDASKGTGGWVYAPGTPVAVWR